MRLLIIEDEPPAQERLKSLIWKYNPAYEILAPIGTVKESIDWFRSNPYPDLIFMDIQLSDGNSFEILAQLNLRCPIVFVTAYDRYLLNAFEFHSIDYLLKPLKESNLFRALDKYNEMKTHFSERFQGFTDDYFNAGPRERLITQKGNDSIIVDVKDIAYIFTEQKLLFVIDKSGNRTYLDETLSTLEKMLPSDSFFRLNRKYIANLNAIKKFRSYYKGRILVELHPPTKEEVIVSQETAGKFKEWLNG